jgi:hypothetical protein
VNFFLVASCMTGHFLCVWSLPLRRAQSTLFLLVAAQQGLCAPESFFCGVRSGVHAESFFWVCMQSPVTSPLSGRAQHFSWTFLLCPRTSHACVSGAQIFPVQSLPAAARTFFYSPTLLPCAQPFALVASHCVTCAARKQFFWHLPSAVSGSLTTLVRTS